MSSLIQLPNPDTTTLVIRVRAFDGNLFVASTPNQGHYRSASCEQGFAAAANSLIERHYGNQRADLREISPNDARVSALNMKPCRLDHDAKETRWFVAHVEIAD